MRSCFVIIFLFTAFLAQSQDVKTESLEAFSELKVYDRLQVRLIPSQTNSIEVSGEYADKLKLVNNKGSLKVKMSFSKAFEGEDTMLKIFYKDLKIIDANEGAFIQLNDTLSKENLELRVQEGARIQGNLKVKNLNIRANSGGSISVRGKSNYQEVKISTGGTYEAKSLTTTVSDIRVQAGGKANIYATELAKLIVRAGGTINVYGDPKNVEQTKFIAGSINIMP